MSSRSFCCSESSTLLVLPVRQVHLARPRSRHVGQIGRGAFGVGRHRIDRPRYRIALGRLVVGRRRHEDPRAGVIRIEAQDPLEEPGRFIAAIVEVPFVSQLEEQIGIVRRLGDGALERAQRPIVMPLVVVEIALADLLLGPLGHPTQPELHALGRVVEAMLRELGVAERQRGDAQTGVEGSGVTALHVPGDGGGVDEGRFGFEKITTAKSLRAHVDQLARVRHFQAVQQHHAVETEAQRPGLRIGALPLGGTRLRRRDQFERALRERRGVPETSSVLEGVAEMGVDQLSSRAVDARTTLHVAAVVGRHPSLQREPDRLVQYAEGGRALGGVRFEQRGDAFACLRRTRRRFCTGQRDDCNDYEYNHSHAHDDSRAMLTLRSRWKACVARPLDSLVPESTLVGILPASARSCPQQYTGTQRSLLRGNVALTARGSTVLDERVETFIRRLDGIGWFDVLPPARRADYLIAVRASQHEPPCCLPGLWVTPGSASERSLAEQLMRLSECSYDLLFVDAASESEPGLDNADRFGLRRLQASIDGAAHELDYATDDSDALDADCYHALRELVERAVPGVSVALLPSGGAPWLLAICGLRAYQLALAHDVLPSPDPDETDEESDDDDDPADAWKRGRN